MLPQAEKEELVQYCCPTVEELVQREQTTAELAPYQLEAQRSLLSAAVIVPDSRLKQACLLMSAVLLDLGLVLLRKSSKRDCWLPVMVVHIVYIALFYPLSFYSVLKFKLSICKMVFED
jgi:hypothetical protein